MLKARSVTLNLLKRGERGLAKRGGWSRASMDTLDPRGVTRASPPSWVGLGYLMEERVCGWREKQSNEIGAGFNPRSLFAESTTRIRKCHKFRVRGRTYFSSRVISVDLLPPRQTVVLFVWEVCEHQTSDHGSSHRRSAFAAAVVGFEEVCRAIAATQRRRNAYVRPWLCVQCLWS
ncbi:hypothetical protein EVAR_15668_1 [Eumeta japonica]|uniref:Uncharacterized protein n=1 Tax=Eumeta variegata TaxID=151549 RepID=A0A4C1UAR3_EUMVA|nr:hypothetical protein EVAR_15668_1 [Eumeta japonica]